jgi:hypothetical protein
MRCRTANGAGIHGTAAVPILACAARCRSRTREYSTSLRIQTGGLVKHICFLLVFFCGCIASAAPAQPTSASSPNSSILGQGTANHIAKFNGAHNIKDTAIVELAGCMSESQTLDGSKSGVLCLHDVTGSGTTIHALSAFPTDRITFLGENDSSTGDPVGVQGFTTSADRGIGVRGQATNSAGNGIGVLGESWPANGAAGAFNHIGDNTLVTIGDGTNMIIGVHAGSGGVFNDLFRVDHDGNVFAASYNIGGADFAESMSVTGKRSQYEPGDLLAIDRTAHGRLARSNRAYSTLVAGIYSTKPGIVGSQHTMDDPAFASEVPMAVVGIVPCKVSAENGPIGTGDLLVASSTPGYAMKGTDRNKMLGAVVGKALEPLKNDRGLIQVLVTLQ